MSKSTAEKVPSGDFHHLDRYSPSNHKPIALSENHLEELDGVPRKLETIQNERNAQIIHVTLDPDAEIASFSHQGVNHSQESLGVLDHIADVIASSLKSVDMRRGQFGRIPITPEVKDDIMHNAHHFICEIIRNNRDKNENSEVTKAELYSSLEDKLTEMAQERASMIHFIAWMRSFSLVPGYGGTSARVGLGGVGKEVESSLVLGHGMATKVSAFVGAPDSPLKDSALSIGEGKKGSIGFLDGNGEEYHFKDTYPEKMVQAILIAYMASHTIPFANLNARETFLAECGLSFQKLQENGVRILQPNHASPDVFTGQYLDEITAILRSMQYDDDSLDLREENNNYDITYPSENYGGIQVNVSKITAMGVVEAAFLTWTELRERSPEDMNILIEGGGGVGENMIGYLINDKGMKPTQITVVEAKGSTCKKLSTKYPDITVLEGAGREYYDDGYVAAKHINTVLLCAQGNDVDDSLVRRWQDEGVEMIYGAANSMYDQSYISQIGDLLRRKPETNVDSSLYLSDSGLDTEVNYGGWFAVTLVEFIRQKFEQQYGGRVPPEISQYVVQYVERVIVDVIKKSQANTIHQARESGRSTFDISYSKVYSELEKMSQEFENAYYAFKSKDSDRIAEVLTNIHIGNIFHTCFAEIEASMEEKLPQGVASLTKVQIKEALLNSWT